MKPTNPLKNALTKNGFVHLGGNIWQPSDRMIIKAVIKVMAEKEANKYGMV